MLLGLHKNLTFNSGKVYPYATGGDYVYLYEEGNKTYRVHEFLSTGTSTLNVEVGGQMEYLIVGGGGGGGAQTVTANYSAGGGGAGGVLSGTTSITNGTYSITVGGGGAGAIGGVNSGSGGAGSDGSNSSFNGNTAIGGGGGGGRLSTGAWQAGRNGGSGGGGTNTGNGSGTSGQGNDGGLWANPGGGATLSGGGGGASQAGENASAVVPLTVGDGGDGVEWPIGSSKYYGGGGGAGGWESVNVPGGGGSGGIGGGGKGGAVSGTISGNAQSGTANTGGGGGGGGRERSNGGTGGSGIVIVRYVVAEKKLWTPSELTGLDLWFDVSRETPQADDTEMTGLTDFSGNGRNLTAYGTVKPKYRTNLLNGLPGVRFTEAGVFWTTNWQTGNFPKIWSPVTFCSVFNIRSGNVNTGLLVVFQYDQVAPSLIRHFNYGHNHTYSNSWVGWRNYFGFGYPGPVQPYITTGRGSPGVYTSTINASGVSEFRENGTILTPGLYYDGTCSPVRSDLSGLFENTCASLNLTSNSVFNGFSIGGGVGNTSTPSFSYAHSDNYFYEIVYYNAELSVSDRQKLEGYLAHKWGLTKNLPAGHPYKYEPPYKVEPEEIVTDGLVLNLDAGDYASYPRSGTTWYDISGNGLNGTLTNGPTYDSANKGSIVFSDTDDTVLVGNLGSFTAMTICTFMKRNGTQVDYAGVVYSRGTSVTGLDFRPSNNNLTYTWNNAGDTFNWDSGLVPPDGEWCMVALTVTSSSAIMYLCTSSGISTATNSVSHTSTTFDDLKIGEDETGPRHFKGSLSTVQIYNRALSSTEISQNFNALRGRYGI